MAGYCVSVSDLHMNYGNVAAVDGISFNVDYGRVFGFLGPTVPARPLLSRY
ncbi:MAG: hypothetical protein ABI347_09225 [Nitrososphaera sp.]|jgi:ABC-type multidrug transport system ATPase subunit